MELQYFGQILKNTQISNFMKIRWVEPEVFHAGGRTDTDGQMDRHDELIVAFRSFANAK